MFHSTDGTWVGGQCFFGFARSAAVNLKGNGSDPLRQRLTSAQPEGDIDRISPIAGTTKERCYARCIVGVQAEAR